MMKGNVLQAPTEGSAGLISGDDNQRYLFNADDVKSGLVKGGDRVDFDSSGDRARDVFSVENRQSVPSTDRSYLVRPPLSQLWFTFSGRAPRYDYWVRGMLFCTLMIIPAVILDAMIFGLESEGGLFSPLAILLCAWVSLVLSVKRLRDMDKSPWMVLLSMVPIANLVVWIMIGFVPGTVGKNQYGEDPLGSQE